MTMPRSEGLRDFTHVFMTTDEKGMVGFESSQVWFARPCQQIFSKRFRNSPESGDVRLECTFEGHKSGYPGSETGHLPTTTRRT